MRVEATDPRWLQLSSLAQFYGYKQEMRYFLAHVDGWKTEYRHATDSFLCLAHDDSGLLGGMGVRSKCCMLHGDFCVTTPRPYHDRSVYGALLGQVSLLMNECQTEQMVFAVPRHHDTHFLASAIERTVQHAKWIAETTPKRFVVDKMLLTRAEVAALVECFSKNKSPAE